MTSAPLSLSREAKQAVVHSTSTAAEPDRDIANRAAILLRGNAYSALRRVSCECRGGYLVLHGDLPSYFLKQIAQSAVAQVPGIKGVENCIEVLS